MTPREIFNLTWRRFYIGSITFDILIIVCGLFRLLYTASVVFDKIVDGNFPLAKK